MDGRSPAALEPVEHVVAVGASAGGLEALEALFDHLAPSTGAAFVVITHLSPDFKSIMDELLARRTAMAVHVVEDGARLAANNVYVIPPGKDMIVQAGRLFLTDRAGHGAPSAPIDLFFGALASAYGAAATGVILSGTGKDGAQGARALRAAGGYVIAQSVETARFDGMPRAVAETGAVDAFLAPEDMGAAIVARIARMDAEEAAPAAVDGGESAGVARVLELVLGGANVDFSEYKKTTILRRIAKRIQGAPVDGIDGYIALLNRDENEVRLLAEDLLIVVTEFFRDTDVFDLLAATVAPELVAAAFEDRPVRIWVPAVGTGQEAYSIAMLLAEAAHAAGREPRVQIFATDISAPALERAALGVYTEAEMAAVSPARRERFFGRTDDGQWQIDPEIRNWIVFAQHNMLRDPPFINTNLISCRNALIYLEHTAQNKALSLFHFSLAPDGYLLLGPSESVNDDGLRFSVVDSKWRLFRKRAAERRDAVAMGELIAGSRWQSEAAPRRRPAPVAGARGVNASALQQVLELFAPGGLLIGRDRELLHVVGDARRHMEPPQAGPFTRDATKLVRKELRAALATAIERVMRENQPLAFAAGDGDSAATLTAHPLAAQDGSVDKVFVAFGPAPEAPTPSETAAYDHVAEQRIAYLEDALRQERENLQAMLEQLETSNEELQSTNEELMTANEELQSTNEELHSVNEELYTVNAEYERKNEELTQLTKDVSSLLQATGVGVVFVSRDLEVRRFTATAMRVVNLMHGDEGRRLSHITHRLTGFDLVGWLEGSMASGELAEEERAADDGTVWLVRAAPVRDGRTVTGAVVSLIDVTRLAEAEAEALTRSEELRHLLEWVGAVSLHFAPDGTLLRGLGDWAAFTGQDVAGFAGKDDGAWLEMVHPEDAEAARSAWRDARRAERPFELSVRLRRPDGGWRPVALAGGPTREGGEGGRLVGWFLYASDAAVAAAAQRDAASAYARATALAGLAFAGSYTLDEAGGTVDADAALAALLGLPAGRQPADGLEARLTPESRRARAAAMAERSLRDGGWSVTLRLTAADGAARAMREVGVTLGGGMAVAALTPIDGQSEDAALAEEILRSSPVEVVVMDAETLRVLRANAAALRSLGFDETQITRLDYTALLPEHDPDSFRAALEPLRAGEVDEISFETFALRRDGSTYDLSLTVRAMLGGARLAAIGRDVTARRRADETLRRRNEALARARRDLEDFAFAAGHDLIAPLGALSDEARGAGADGAARETLDRIAARAGRLQRQVRDLLAYARTDTDDENAGPVPLTRAARGAVKACAAAIEAAGARVEVDELPVVRGTEAALRLALKAVVEQLLADGAGAAPDLRIRPLDEGTDGMAAVEIVDVAEGKPARDLSAPGLALCRRIVEAHGGAMELSGPPDARARVVLRLPTP